MGPGPQLVLLLCDEAGVPAHATMVRPPFVSLQIYVCSLVLSLYFCIRVYTCSSWHILDVVRPHRTLSLVPRPKCIVSIIAYCIMLRTWVWETSRELDRIVIPWRSNSCARSNCTIIVTYKCYIPTEHQLVLNHQVKTTPANLVSSLMF